MHSPTSTPTPQAALYGRLMTAPRWSSKILLMSGMYPNIRRKAMILVAGEIAGGICWILIRQQAGITDCQFLKSMIPHMQPVSAPAAPP